MGVTINQSTKNGEKKIKVAIDSYKSYKENMSPIIYTIRSFSPSDMGKIEKILTQIGETSQYIEGQKKSIERLMSVKEGSVFIAVNNNGVLGCIQIQHLRWNHLSYVHGIVVSAQCRRHGIASQLMAYVEKEAQAKGNHGVFVDTPSDNQAGRAFYKAQGYAEIYTTPSYHEDDLEGVTYLKSPLLIPIETCSR